MQISSVLALTNLLEVWHLKGNSGILKDLFISEVLDCLS